MPLSSSLNSAYILYASSSEQFSINSGGKIVFFYYETETSLSGEDSIELTPP